MTRMPRYRGARFSVGLLLLAAAVFSSITVTSVRGADDAPELNGFGQPTYGVDTSFPIHHDKVIPADENPLGDKQTAYDEFIEGCRNHYGGGRKGKACDSTERDRIAMGLRQPQSMQNYTELGFKKIKAPEAVFKLIKEFWENNKDRATEENWSTGNTYTNHWVSNTDFVSIENPALRGGGAVIKQRIWDAARSTLQEWVGQELTQCSLYGIRIYKEDSVLATHVDRMPLVTSAIINVDQDVDEPWPIEVYAHDGKAYNVTMEPGDMVLYESHSVLHGRPFPMKGRFYANIFIHFEPIGHSLRHGAAGPEGDTTSQYRRAVEEGTGGGHEHDTSIPPYIVEGTEEAERYHRQHPEGWKSSGAGFDTGSTPAHKAAMTGDVNSLKELAITNKAYLTARDSNGWMPIHEASRGGHREAVELLLSHGADVNAVSNHGRGKTPLRLAKEEHGDDHPLVEYLLSIDAIDSGPDL